MIETEIDSSTGLPALPAYHYWEVSGDTIRINKRLPDTKWYQLRPNASAGSRQFIRLPGGFQIAMNSDGSCPESMFLDIVPVIVDVSSQAPRGTTVNSSHEIFIYRGVNLYETVKERYFGSPTTNRNILKRCQKMVNAMAKEAESALLNGPYPNKKFVQDSGPTKTL